MKWKTGDLREVKVQITDKMIKDFAQATGDFNPIHMDEEYAAKTKFKKRIAHGILSAGLISRILANEIPGPGAIYMGQTLKFKSPVYINDILTVRATIANIREEKNIITLNTVCINQSAIEVLEGEATVWLPS